MDNDIKQNILHEIELKGEMFRKISPIQYRIRCPICGDSQKDPRDAHCYIKCSFDPTEPVQYNCFLCNSNGRVGKYFLEKLGINKDLISKVESEKYNKLMTYKEGKEILNTPPVMNSPQVGYINERLGPGFTEKDYERFKIIWDLNVIYEYITSIRVRNTMPSNFDTISFLSDDHSLMLTRTFLEGKESQWMKRRIYPSTNKAFYTIKSTLNLFTEDKIVVNIAEGIFDILSVYKNFNDCENSVFIALLGSDYVAGVDYAIAKGFLCSNVELRIYMDTGKDEKLLKKQLKYYKWIFGSIKIYKNIAWKDVGVSADKINLIEYKV